MKMKARNHILLAIVVTFLLGLLVMLLWNALLPSLFGLPRVSYFQAMGLFILCHLLFGGFQHKEKHEIAQRKREFLRRLFSRGRGDWCEDYDPREQRPSNWSPRERHHVDTDSERRPDSE
jgi:predicted ferric reductase